MSGEDVDVVLDILESNFFDCEEEKQNTILAVKQEVNTFLLFCQRFLSLFDKGFGLK